jgi:hypothetical protein
MNEHMASAILGVSTDLWIRDMQFDTQRTARRLAELGNLFSTGVKQRRFFEQAETLLKSRSSEYYPLLKKLCTSADAAPSGRSASRSATMRSAGALPGGAPRFRAAAPAYPSRRLRTTRRRKRSPAPLPNGIRSERAHISSIRTSRPIRTRFAKSCVRTANARLWCLTLPEPLPTASAQRHAFPPGRTAPAGGSPA